MSLVARLPLGVGKELRALAPLWAACAAAMVAAAVVRDGRVAAVAMLAFAVGSIALGAQSIGHEYTHRTLALLLSQPADRRRLLLTKLAILAPMLVTLAALAWWILFRDFPVRRAAGWHDFPAPLLITTCALFLAPWFTMLSRSAMAGIVFTATIPPCFLIVGDIVGTWKYGVHAGAPIDRLKFDVLWVGTLSICAFAAVAGWRTFMRLEAIEGGSRDLHLPRWRAAATRSTRRHPVLLLIKKELRLQQLTFALVGFYAALGLSIWAAALGAGAWSRALVPVTIVYIMLLAVLIGSLASAEERQFGTLDVQLLLPFAVWKQWVIKAGLALALALILGFGLPAAVSLLTEGTLGSALSPRGLWITGLGVVVLTSSSLYISSLCSSGVRAVVMTLPAIAGVVLFMQPLGWALDRLGNSALLTGVASAVPEGLRNRAALRFVVEMTPAVLATSVAAALLWFAFRNHRSHERSFRHVFLQLLVIAGVVTVGMTLVTLAIALYHVN